MHLAELDHAGTVLKRERSPGIVLAVLDISGLLAVEHDDEMRALRGDLVGIPFARRFRHRINLGNVDDRTGAIARVRPLVEDVDLIADLGVDLVPDVTADENAAIGLLVGPELRLDLKILVGILADEVGENMG